MHSTQIITEIRALTPEDGWARYEATGRACAVCPCGLNTGFIDKGAAADAYREHVSPGQKIRISVGGNDRGMRDMIRRIVRDNPHGTA